ncbi:MAG: hypothetical protein DMG54_16210 [Acidobacteria bacterium]|nr:MAG: hypothetical protein DMG54_16210 [Acidobacteriota bacterium]PYU49689.1 MAG: hypothetical protein DMG53_04555 [Acidobacteriota bacterium]PYU69852.1 MAG: hypothetical protein DMG52_27570 [Acidobacteriota bacterium]
MTVIRRWAAITLLSLAYVSISSGQDTKGVNPAPAPPSLLLLVHQEIQYGKANARKKLGVAMARACNRLEVPNSWIGLESLTGPRESLFFDPFDSFEQLEQSFDGWKQIYAAHPDLARMQEEIDALLISERTIVAVRRDDLGYQADSIDLSETRFMRVVEVRLAPGRENEFVETFKILGEAFEKIKADSPWVVYQVNLGMQSPGFLIFMPMHALKQNDDLLSWKENLQEAEGGEAMQRLQQIARESYASTESNLYAVDREISHVSKEFAAGDPNFWTPTPVPSAKPVGKKGSAIRAADPDTTQAIARKTRQRTRNR